MSRKRPTVKLQDVTPDPIVMEDHTLKANRLWTEAVEVSGYDIVGEEDGVVQPGAYVSWRVTLRTVQGTVIRVPRRYSEFDDLRGVLLKEFARSGLQVPELPPKTIVAKFDARFLEERRRGLEYFLRRVLLDPAYADSYALRAFVKTH